MFDILPGIRRREWLLYVGDMARHALMLSLAACEKETYFYKFVTQWLAGG